MKHFARNLPLALAICLAFGGTADAKGTRAPAKNRQSQSKVAKQRAIKQSAAKTSTTPIVDGRTARPLILKALKAKGRTSEIAIVKEGISTSGKSGQYFAVNKNGGLVRTFNVRLRDGKPIVQEGKIGGLTQKQATSIANTILRREKAPKKGTFAGVRKLGVTKRGNLKFGSQTDKNEFVFINPNTGRVSRKDS